jgi:NADH-quinone oxidoreductase subunit F
VVPKGRFVVSLVHRVLYPQPIVSLEEYLARGGGAGLEAARDMTPDALIAEVLASGLRGRGGAGFPTGIKWRTVRDYHADRAPSTVVANGAEGEPGTYKDRTILRTTPYAVIEGALIAARAVGADEIVFGLKKSFGPEVARLRSAVDEVKAAGWADTIRLAVFEGPNEYLYGEETALLETIEGRYPFPRIAPPWRRGDREVVERAGDASSRSGLSSHVVMAEADSEGAPPTLVDNVETLANIPRIVARGAAWFRTEGTEKSPGTIVCTVIGDVQREGVGEVIMGTPLRDVIDAISGGPRPGRRIKAVLPGVSTGVITGDQLDVPLTYEDMAAIGVGLGSGGFMVFDDTADLAAVAAGVSRFLAVESCGQCTPCKLDGVALSGLLDKLCQSNVSETEWRRILSLVSTVGDRARCTLGTQHQTVIDSIIRTFPDDLAAHVSGAAKPVTPRLIAELVEFSGDEAVLDERHLEKQPDWTYDAEDSGQSPADRYGEHRHQVPLEE